jgi:hypothetical protein
MDKNSRVLQSARARAVENESLGDYYNAIVGKPNIGILFQRSPRMIML